MGRLLQLSMANHNQDHIPVMFVIKLGGNQYETHTIQRWNFDSILRAVICGDRRWEFFDKVASNVDERATELEEAEQKHNPSAMLHELTWCLRTALENNYE